MSIRHAALSYDIACYCNWAFTRANPTVAVPDWRSQPAVRRVSGRRRHLLLRHDRLQFLHLQQPGEVDRLHDPLVLLRHHGQQRPTGGRCQASLRQL